MTLEAGVQAFLIAMPYQTALENRWYKYKAPQGSSTQKISYGIIGRVSVDPVHTHGGPADTIRRRIQLSVWSPSHETGATVADAVRRLLDGFAGQMGDVPVRQFLWAADGYFFEETTALHHFWTDFRTEYIDTP